MTWRLSPRDLVDARAMVVAMTAGFFAELVFYAVFGGAGHALSTYLLGGLYLGAYVGVLGNSLLYRAYHLPRCPTCKRLLR